jgi:hypothetical protein
VPGLTATTEPRSWLCSDAQLLLAEAFITAAGKPEPLAAGQHAADAAAAGRALVDFLATPQTLSSAVQCAPQESFSLPRYGNAVRRTSCHQVWEWTKITDVDIEGCC